MAETTITMRTDAARKRRLRQAAGIADQNLTSFILSAAEAEADRLIDAARFTDIDSTFFDQFDAHLAGAPIPALQEAAQRMASLVTQSD
jgi:uncharacterized protein (DUF1778 family)